MNICLRAPGPITGKEDGSQCIGFVGCCDDDDDVVVTEEKT